MDRKWIATYVLIAALAFVFLCFGVWKFTDPLLWIGFMPTWIDGLLGFSRDAWLSVFGAIEIGLAALLLVPIRRARQLGAALIVLHLLGVVTQVGWNDVGVRDIGLLLSSLALLLLL